MFEDLRNSIDFFIRNNTKFSRKNFTEKKWEILERNRRENLYTKDVLAKYFSKTKKNNLRVLDIGCKNWFYAKGEYEFFNTLTDKLSLDGVELDAFRLYSNFYSRYEVAKFYTSELDGVNYIAGNLLDLEEKYDYIVWFLPFVLESPHLYWGLPKRLFYPEKLLKHAYSLLKNGGEMLIVNQGNVESIEQERLLNQLKIPYISLGEVLSEYFEYKHKRFGFLIQKK